jgi:hypothetical protein
MLVKYRNNLYIPSRLTFFLNIYWRLQKKTVSLEAIYKTDCGGCFSTQILSVLLVYGMTCRDYYCSSFWLQVPYWQTTYDPDTLQDIYWALICLTCIWEVLVRDVIVLSGVFHIVTTPTIILFSLLCVIIPFYSAYSAVGRVLLNNPRTNQL